MALICANTTSTTLHAEIGVIFQDFMRYEMTARENIAVGRIEVPHARTIDRIRGAKRAWPTA